MDKMMNKERRWIAGIKPPDEMLTMSMTAIFEKECREQPERLAQLFRAYDQDQSLLKELHQLRQIALSPGPILFLGMGASYCSSIAGSVWLQSCHRSSFFADAGEWLHYAPTLLDQVAASVLTTASGESAELVELCKIKTQKPVILICNNEKSTCWSLMQIKLPILAGPEYGSATKTYTNATAACIVLASAMAGHSWRGDAERLLADYSEALNHVFGIRGELEKFCRGAANIEVVGRGPGYGGAIMGSLTMREMAGYRASAHSGAGFRHGPLLDVNASHVAIIFALGRTADLGVKLARDCNARGGRVILIGSEQHRASEKLLSVKISAVPEPWEALTSVLVPQALALGMMERSGANLAPRFEYGVMEE
jgi:glucosamine--fructose-6-phosphate aminotransferase (isomerizing)